MLRLVSAAASLAAMLLVSVAPAAAQSRVALVIGNSAYTGAPPLRTTTADADLVASSLQAAGFDIVRANDVTTANFGDTIAAFVEKIAAGGPSTVAFVYFAGYGVQYDGDSYLVPVDAAIGHAEDVPNVTMSLTAIEQALAQVPAAARIIVLDAARDGGFANADASPLAPGLALVGVPPGFLLAYPAAPGADICACAEDQPNSPYASSLATLLRQPGLEISQIFDGVRLQINQASGGAQVPWMVSALGVEVRFFQAPEAPRMFLSALGVPDLPVPPLEPVQWTVERYRALSADEAYRIAIERDSLETYQWFVEAFPTYPLAGQIWQIIEWRRESILWHRALVMGTVAAYWNYLDAYPDGRYARSARYWLALNHAPLVPQGYTPVVLDLPPGYVDEAIGLPIVVERGRPVPRYFGNVQPVYVAAVPRWTPQRAAIVVRPPPPPPPPTLIVRQAAFVQRAPVVRQPVQPVFNPALTVQQQQQKQRDLQAWQGRVQQQQEALAKQYHAPVVAPASIVVRSANEPGQRRTGIQIPSKPGLAPPPPNRGTATAPNGTQQAVTPPPNKGLTIPNAKPAPNGTQHAVTPPPQQTPGGTKPGPGGVQRAVTPPPQSGKPPGGPTPQERRVQEKPVQQPHPQPPKPAPQQAQQPQPPKPAPPPPKPAPPAPKPAPPPPKPAPPPPKPAPSPPKPAPPPPKPAPPPPKPPQPAPKPPACPPGQHMVNGHCVR